MSSSSDEIARRLRATTGPLPGLAAIRSSLGALVARPGALWREQRVRVRRVPSRLPGAIATGWSTPSIATGRTTISPGSSSPATSCDPDDPDAIEATGFLVAGRL